jgi:hypothetical protein
VREIGLHKQFVGLGQPEVREHVAAARRDGLFVLGGSSRRAFDAVLRMAIRLMVFNRTVVDLGELKELDHYPRPA